MRSWPFLLLLFLLLLAFALSLALGSVSIPLEQVVRILLGGEADKASWATILFDFRLPKAVTAALVGAALAVAGLQMQTLFRNWPTRSSWASVPGPVWAWRWWCWELASAGR